MTPYELLRHTPIRILKSDGIDNEEIFDLLKNEVADCFPRIILPGTDTLSYWRSLAHADNTLMIKIYKYDEVNVVGVLFYAYQPVMIIKQTASSSDHWILSQTSYDATVSHLLSLLDIMMPVASSSVDPSADIPELIL